MSDIDGTGEMLECLDILMAAAEFRAEQEEHLARVFAFANYYAGLAEQDESGDLQDEYFLQSDVLTSLRPEPDFTDEELTTALWQTAQLSMFLLQDHMMLIDQLQGRVPAPSTIAVPEKRLIIP